MKTKKLRRPSSTGVSFHSTSQLKAFKKFAAGQGRSVSGQLVWLACEAMRLANTESSVAEFTNGKATWSA